MAKTKPNLSPWFNARKQPPVNGDNYSRYQWRCLRLGVRPMLAGKKLIRNNSCRYCEWRGVLK